MKPSLPALTALAVPFFLGFQTNRKIMKHSRTKRSEYGPTARAVICKKTIAILRVLALLVNTVFDLSFSKRGNLRFPFGFTATVKFREV